MDAASDDRPLPLTLWGARPWTPRKPDLSIRIPVRSHDASNDPRSAGGASVCAYAADPVLSERGKRGGFAGRSINIAGRKFGRLTAERRDERRLRGYWICTCDCGARVSRTSDNLASPGRHDCGNGCPLRVKVRSGR